MHPETQKTGCLLVQLLGLGSLDVSCPSFLSLLQVFLFSFGLVLCLAFLLSFLVIPPKTLP